MVPHAHVSLAPKVFHLCAAPRDLPAEADEASGARAKTCSGRHAIAVNGAYIAKFIPEEKRERTIPPILPLAVASTKTHAAIV